jgi:hypothetical protein
MAETHGISIEMLTAKQNVIKEIDAQITAASGNDSAARKAVIDGILASNSEAIEKTFNNLMSQLATLPSDVFVGLITKLDEAAKGELKTKIDSVVDERVKANAGEAVDVDKLKEQRKAELEVFRALKVMLASLGTPQEELDKVEEPRRSGGGRTGSGTSSAKTGMNKEGYRYLMDGKGRPTSQNSFSSLAFYATNGLDEQGNKVPDGVKSKMSSKGLRAVVDAELAKQGLKFGEADSWEVTLANGTKIGARRFDPEVDAKDGFTFGDDSTDEPATNGDAAPAAEPVPATA